MKVLIAELALFLFIAKRAMSVLLEILNVSHLRKMSAFVPVSLSGIIDKETSEKSLSYLALKSRFDIFRSLFSDILILFFIFSPLFNMYNSVITGMNINYMLQGLVFFAVLSAASQLLDIPWALYDAFFIENKFGFNRMSISLWIMDFIKSFIIETAILCLAVIAGLWIIGLSPGYWWFIIWLFFFILSITLMYISPYIIEPLFNKFEPLDNPELVEKIKGLCEKAGIKAGQVLKMDASKRSSHSNAYFTGIGNVKRIIILDTLIGKLTDGELLSVIAHEAGHWKKKHVIKSIISFEIIAELLLFVCYLFFRTNILPDIFGIQPGGLFAKIIIAGFLLSIISYYFDPVCSYFSRKNEREADRFAVGITGGYTDLQNSLVKLYKDNLSNLFPHPLYVLFYYSHPPLLERLKELSAYGEGDGAIKK
jgi:STE24 endopeptidase